jgi:hypothetical protein
MFRAIVLSLVSLAMVATATGAFAQAISGNLVGTVIDSSSAVVTGATVAATKMDTGVTTTTTTNNTGAYHFENLPVGTYKVVVTSRGFKTSIQQVDVVLNQTGTLNVTLTLGATTETIEVSGVAATIDTTSAQLQSTFDNRYSQDLGITSAGGVGAGVLNLSLLSAGVAQVSSMGIGVGPSVGGQRPYNNNFTVEGVDNNNKAVTGNLITVPNDAVDNFTLLTNQFNTEFGHSSGGQFNTTIKSGTNNFHGSLYEYFRNRNLNAVDNAFVLQGFKSNPRFDSNRYGGTFGGPIIKNKLFFFTNFERQGISLTATAGGQVLTPTADGLGAIATDPNLSANNFSVFKQYVPVAAGQASTGDPANPCLIGVNAIAYTGAPAVGTCAGGAIPIGAVSVAAPAWQNYTNFVQSVDYNISNTDQLRGRYIYNKVDKIDQAANLAAFYTVEPFRFHLFTIGEYHSFTPSILNEFRVGYNRYFNNLPAGNFKYPGLDAFPNLILLDLGGSGLQIGPDSQAPQFTIQNTYQFVDNVNWTRGAHTLKFGGEYRWYISPQSFTQRQRGDYNYNSTQRFLDDISPDNFGERSQGSLTYYGNQKAIYLYANDNWKLKPNLTLDLGIRYEYTTISSSEAHQALNTISNTPSIIVGGAVNQPLLFNKPQAPKTNWAPRVGIAYSPGSSGRTSIRAGFGLAYDVLYDNIGILAVPPQIGATNDVPDLNCAPSTCANFLANGGLPGGGSGIQILPEADARAATSNWIPPNVKFPYSINWNLGVQHSFGKDYVAEIRYVGTRGVHLDVQDRINRRALVSPQAFLPTFLQQPSQAELDALTNTLTSLKAPGSMVPEFANAGFGSNIVADIPDGWSVYHGLQTQLTRRFTNGLTFQAAYTFSRTIDNSTADFFSTSLTPRRPQDFRNWDAEKSVSALSRAHRLTLSAVYDLPFFKSDSWVMKNILGNWSFSPVYTYESPQWATVQSATDSNLNGDSAGDRVILNPGGVRGTGSGVTALTNSGGETVAYLANNPSAQYIVAGAGALATTGRNTLATRPTNDLSLSTYKEINFTERFKLRLGAQFANLFNHPQYIPGSNPGQGLGVNDVTSFLTGPNSTSYLNYLTPGNSIFNNPKAVFASNARTIALIAKFTF